VLRADAPDLTLPELPGRVVELPGRAPAPRRLTAGLLCTLGAGLARVDPGRLPVSPPSFSPSSFSTCTEAWEARINRHQAPELAGIGNLQQVALGLKATKMLGEAVDAEMRNPACNLAAEVCSLHRRPCIAPAWMYTCCATPASGCSLASDLSWSSMARVASFTCASCTASKRCSHNSNNMSSKDNPAQSVL
jgi:hypothetical protein